MIDFTFEEVSEKELAKIEKDSKYDAIYDVCKKIVSQEIGKPMKLVYSNYVSHFETFKQFVDAMRNVVYTFQREMNENKQYFVKTKVVKKDEIIVFSLGKNDEANKEETTK
jgi:hypothetical protein